MKSLLPLFSIVLLLMFPGFICGESLRELEKHILDRLTNVSTYDARIRPSGVNNSDGPVVVNVNMFIRSISKINEADMDYSIQVTFRQQWVDKRLHYDYQYGTMPYLSLMDHDGVWKPDLFFSNEKEGHMHNLLKPNSLIRIFPGGEVLYSVRLSLLLSCPMDLKNFPFDTQTCSIIIASYGFTTEDLIFLWKESDPVQVTRNLHQLTFTLSRFKTDYCTSRTNTGEYSCLKVDLQFKREFTYYLYQIYIPFCTFVIMSWITFWIDKNQVTGRIFLAVSALLAMSFFSYGVNIPLPKTSYTKALDVWSGVCHLFAFSALVEFVLVSYIHRKGAVLDPVYLKKVEIAESDKKSAPQEKGKMNWRVLLAKLPAGSTRIDVFSRILFPVAFVIFNVIYWSTYISRSEE